MASTSALSKTAGTRDVGALLALVLGMGFALPLDLAGVLGFQELPLSALDVIALGSFALAVRTIRHSALSATLLSCALLALVIAIFETAFTSKLRPILSYGRFFLVYVTFFVGYALIRTSADLKKFLYRVCLVFSLVIIAVMARTPLVNLRDSLFLFGIPIYGTDGVNAFAVYTALVGMILTSLLLSGWGKARVIAIPGAIMSLLYPLAVVSRQAIVAVALYLAALFLRKMFERDWRAVITVIVASAIVGGVLYQVAGEAGAAVVELIVVKSEDTSELLQGNVSTGTSGRSDLAGIMLDKVTSSIQNMLFGTRFSGFDASYFSDDFGQGTSPHNQYLGAWFKMGLVAAAFYYLFLAGCFLLFVKYARLERPFGFYLLVVAIICFVVLMNTQDFLTSSLSGNFFMFICGALWAVTGRHGQELEDQ